MERRKYTGKPNKKYIKSSDSKIIRIDDINIKGYVAFLKIFEVNVPFYVKLNDKKICLYDNGYSELNYLPDNQNWQMYALYDNNGKIIDWYFDITKENAIDEEGNPYCDDLYLDIVLMPDGQVIILDEDELFDSYNNEIINQNEYILAYKIKNELINNGIPGFKSEVQQRPRKEF
jgi:predicted RNA-binding protein associated with RNAse of E/G family